MILNFSRIEMAPQDPNLHVALFPWLAFGHLNPFLQLGIALANLGHRVSFLSTPRNLLQLRPKVPRHLLPLITFVELPLPRVAGLPEHAEATVDLPLDLSHLLTEAYLLLRDPVGKFLAESRPDWIIRDIYASWVGAVAREHGAQAILFSVYHVSTMAFMGETIEPRRRCWPTPASLTTKPEWIPFPNSKLAFRRHEAELMHAMIINCGDGWTSGQYDAIAVRGCYENEGEYLELVQKAFTKPVIPVGLLPPVTSSPGDLHDNEENSGMFRWLDEQQPRSVVFVSFGSEYKMSLAEVTELAFGLEQSNVPFLWVLRKPAWLTGDDISEALPAGFLGRTRGRGLVAAGWVPQLEILAHPSVGGSLFHSGWGSIVETLRYGHVLILLPCVFDQGLNARFLAEKGLGVEVERNEDGSFTGAEVARALTTAMVSDEGEALRNKAREAAPVFADQLLHDEYVKKFADYLRAARKKSSNA